MMCQKEFKMMNTNGDGMVSKDEYMAVIKEADEQFFFWRTKGSSAYPSNSQWA